MDERLLQRTRYVLRSRVRRVETCPSALFVSACGHLLDWLDHHLVLAPIMHRLDAVDGTFRIRIQQTLTEGPGWPGGEYDPGFYSAISSQEHVAVCLTLLRAVAGLQESFPRSKHEFLIRCFGEYLSGIGYSYKQEDDAIRILRDVAVDGLYEYLDEQLDARNVLYAILRKYEQRSEWFHRVRLRAVADDGLEGKTGERALAVDLQGYVLDQGVEFIVEPASASGEADLVLRDPDGRYIIVDAKYIPENVTPSIIRDKLSSGFHQVARYCDDYNEPEGFLVTFIRTTKRLRLELEESDGLQLLKLGGKTIYYVAVDIADLPSASKGGRANEVIISAADLVASIPATT